MSEPLDAASWEASLDAPEPPEEFEALGPGEEDEPATETDEPSTAAEGGEEAEQQPPAGEEGEVTDPESAPVEPKPAQAEGKEPEPAPAGDASEWKGFAFKADGTEIHIPGAVESPDGWLLMPKEEALKALQPHLADRTAWRRQVEDYERRLADRDGPSDREVEAGVIVDTFTNLLKQGPDAVFEWLQDWDRSQGDLQSRIRNAVLEHRDQQRTSREAEDTRRAQARRVQEWVPGALRQTLKDTMAMDSFKGLSLDEDALYAALEALPPGSYLQRAQEEIPEWGIKKGNFFIRPDVILAQVEASAKLARKLLSQRKEADQIEAANRRTAGSGKRKAPPTVTGRETPALGGEKKKIQSWEDFEESLFEDD